MNVNYISGKRQEQMVDNGWYIKLPLTPTETPEQIAERLHKMYTRVKVYWVPTRIRGYHHYVAFVKP